MKFSDLLKVMHETQHMTVMYSDYAITGAADTISVWLVEPVLNAEVAAIEPSGDVLRVWLEDFDV